MKKYSNCIIFLFMIFILFGFKVVNAADITIDDVVSYMKENNILDNSDYSYMFGRMFNSEEYDIESISYTVKKEDNKITIDTILKDKNVGEINKTFDFNIEDNLITYTNDSDVNSLESRISAFLFSELIYSVGGARGYQKDIIVDWMNQIDLTSITLEDGIEWTYEKITYTDEKNDSVYKYEINIPKTFKVDILKLTANMPSNALVKIHDIKTDFTSISMSVYADGHLDEMCTIYRRNDDNNDYIKVGTVSCNNGVFTDNNLTDATTYHYQSTVENVIMCSDDVEITTETIPETGAFITIGSIIILIILEIVLCLIYRKHRIIQKI